MANEIPNTGVSGPVFPPYTPDAIAFDNGVMSAPVAWPTRPAVVRPDADLAVAAERALAAELGAPTHGITLRVLNGHLTLEGCAESFYQRACAERALRFLDGVRAVENRIAVQPAAVLADASARVKPQSPAVPLIGKS